jgi:seryl-tRNA synthetase
MILRLLSWEKAAMLDIKRIRQQPEEVETALKRRNPELSLTALLDMDQRRRHVLQQEETLRSERNQLTARIAQAKKAGEDTTDIQQKTKALAERIKALETEKDQLDTAQRDWLLSVPNTPSDATPTGHSDADNPVIREWGHAFKSRTIPNALPHWDIGPMLGILDAERGVKVAQSRFTVMRGLGARLERALIQLMLDTHIQAGYEEILPPFLVNAQAMLGTGQLPKFEEDMFRCKDDELYLIPTAEVPVTNIYADEILAEDQLPIRMAAHTPCFRREAGSAGKDNRGLIRQHQFNKVELVKITTPEQAEAEHQTLVAQAEHILQLLELPYRVVELCTGDLGFSATRCFDIEVWMPGQDCYREISSCSHFGDFQARRANIKFKRMADDGKWQNLFCHTLNGSGLAVGRTVAAILENYQIHQQEVHIPVALHPYWQGHTTRLTVAGKTLETV